MLFPGRREPPALVGRTTIGLGSDGQKVTAGTVWPYRFALATLNDHRLSNELMEEWSAPTISTAATAVIPSR